MREIKSEKFVALVEETNRIDKVVFNSLVNRFPSNHSGLLAEIVDKGHLRSEHAGELWARSIGSTFVDPMSIRITVDVEDYIPVEMAKKIRSVPLYELDNCVTIAMEDPMNLQLIDSLQRFTQKKISPVFALPQDISQAIDIHYQAELSFDEAVKELQGFGDNESIDKEDGEALVELINSNALVETTNRIFYAAFKHRASDIHIESHKNFGRIRLRVDGTLRDLAEVPKKIQQAIIVRIKFLSQLDIADSRMPQDGRFSLELGAFEQNFRVSTCPALHGEKCVVRILGQAGKKSVPTFDEMLLSKSNLKRFRNAVAKPNGVFIVTGPTGSGKTTTLYSALDYLNERGSNIMTIEDPVEIQLPGANHFEVKHKIGLDFKRILRSALRQDPDVILVGEIRDQETAKIATEAALTGHMVLTTLHTNSAVQAITRLIEIGVEPYMVAPSLNGVMSQRLLGRICAQCKEAFHPSEEVLDNYFEPDSYDDPIFFRGSGCRHCHQTGYSGRVAVHEVVELSEEMREAIAVNAPIHEILAAAKEIGYTSMREDALKKATLGLTTLDEVERITVPEYKT